MTNATATERTADRDLLRVTEVARIVGIGLTTLYRWRAEGRFPAPKQLGPRRVGYTRAQIEDWVRTRPSADEGA